MAVMCPSAASFHTIDGGTKLWRTGDCPSWWRRAGVEILRPRHVVYSLIAAPVYHRGDHADAREPEAITYYSRDPRQEAGPPESCPFPRSPHMGPGVWRPPEPPGLGAAPEDAAVANTSADDTPDASGLRVWSAPWGMFLSKGGRVNLCSGRC